MTPIASTPFLKALSRRDDVSAADLVALDLIVGRARNFAPGEELVEQDSMPQHSCLVLSGFTARGHYLRGGRRQLSAVHVPGDFVDLHSLMLKKMDHSVIALTPCTAAFFPHQILRDALARSEHLERMLWLLTLIDAATHRAWIVSLGRRRADSHVAHFFCELFTRLQVVDLVQGDTFDFAIRQADLADMVGFSLVHLNRSLQMLRRAGLLEWKGPKVRIPNLKGLCELAEFDPTYLSLMKEPR